MRDLKTVSRGEVYRYMGFRDELTEPDMRDIIENIIIQVAEATSPKFCAADTSVSTAGEKIVFDGFSVNSKSLSAHLSDCDSAIIFAATLGSGVDMLIYKYSLTSPARAVAAQAAATAMIEMYADDICEIFASEEKKNGLYITKRFSPGYGDLSLDCQSYFIEKLSAGKRIGLCLTDSDMLTPVKSVTAVVGKTKTEIQCSEHKCKECPNRGCAYRQE